MKSRIKLPPRRASDKQIVRFLRSHDPEELLKQGILEIDEDHSDLEEALFAYLSEPSKARLTLRLPPTAKRILEELARRKAVDAQTLVRIWIMDQIRQEILGRSKHSRRT